MLSKANWLTYLAPEGPSELPCVCVNMAQLPELSTAQQTEQISLLIAQNQQDNPLGLFQNPSSDIETLLQFFACRETDQSKLGELIEAMYEYCNNPKHLQFDLAREEVISSTLEKIIDRQTLPFNRNGLVADERGTPSCQFATL